MSHCATKFEWTILDYCASPSTTEQHDAVHEGPVLPAAFSRLKFKKNSKLLKRSLYDLCLGAFFMPHQGHMTSLNQQIYIPQQYHPLMRAQHPNTNVNPGAVGGPTQPPYGHPMNHHSQQIQETPSSIHQMNYNQHPAAYITNAPNVNVSASTAQPTQANYVGGGGGGPATSMHMMTTGPGSSQGGAQVNVDNSTQHNHQYNRNQNEQALIAVPSTGGVPVVSEALTNTSNSGSSTVNTTKPARSKIVVKDPASKQVVDVGEWNKRPNVSFVYFPFQELLQNPFRNFSNTFSKNDWRCVIGGPHILSENFLAELNQAESNWPQNAVVLNVLYKLGALNVKKIWGTA